MKTSMQNGRFLDWSHYEYVRTPFRSISQSNISNSAGSVSDRCASGEATDLSGPKLVELSSQSFEVTHIEQATIPDDLDTIEVSTEKREKISSDKENG